MPAAQAKMRLASDAAISASAIEEVVVSVERREQAHDLAHDLADTAMVIEGEGLRMLGLQNITDLDGNIPDLLMANNAANYVGGKPCLPNAGFAINAACDAAEYSIEGRRPPAYRRCVPAGKVPELSLDAFAPCLLWRVAGRSLDHASLADCLT